MSETMKRQDELWLEGPNYTADAVIIDSLQQKILLIERRDCGEWALPGGFVDADESTYIASLREAKEEASVDIANGQLIYQGIVDDPRNTEYAWIETAAYLFECAETTARAGDDAGDAKWFSIYALPPLYASHAAIVARALDAHYSRGELAIAEEQSRTSVDGGHMNYIKQLVTTPHRTVFIKSYQGNEASNEHVDLLHKEADIMSHLRAHHYPHVPRVSHMQTSQTLAMEPLAPDDGWQWRAPHTDIDRYVHECAAALRTLEQQPLPADTHDIASSFAVHYEEGWHAFTPASLNTLHQFTPLIRTESQQTALRLFQQIDDLSQVGLALALPDRFVLCHHDARQANIAWHKTHGVRLVDWSWADVGRPGSDITTLLIDLKKHGHDISHYSSMINRDHCITMLGFWLEHATRPITERHREIRLQQFLSALTAYEVLEALPERGSGV